MSTHELRLLKGCYFNVGKIDKDPVQRYAARKGWDMRLAERRGDPIMNLQPICNYDDLQRLFGRMDELWGAAIGTPLLGVTRL